MSATAAALTLLAMLLAAALTLTLLTRLAAALAPGAMAMLRAMAAVVTMMVAVVMPFATLFVPLTTAAHVQPLFRRLTQGFACNQRLIYMQPAFGYRVKDPGVVAFAPSLEPRGGNPG